MTKDYFWDRGRIVFRLQTAVYPVSAILKTAYLFIDHFYISLSMDGADLLVAMKGKEAAAGEPEAGEFYNELLNQTLRLYISRETKGVRELIMARALHHACVEVDREDPAPPGDEPDIYNLADIAKNWFGEEAANG